MNQLSFYQSSKAFDLQAIQLYEKQFSNNLIYRSFCDLVHKHPSDCESVIEIPFLPISFFKTHKVLTGNPECSHIFESSGTAGKTSSHHVADIEVYEQSFFNCFELFYGHPNQFAVIGLLPGYLEKPNSSLIYMMQKLIEISDCVDSGFYLDNYQKLHDVLKLREQANQKTFLLGVSFALLDFAEQFPCSLQHTILVETGGMKGRRKELVREELHAQLKQYLDVGDIQSEYGMTELLSQAYAKDNGRFRCPPWMKVLVRNPNNPLDIQAYGTGCLNIIDLANKNSCAFIGTDDLGRVYSDRTFEVIGRVDSSDVRGCNLMVS
ncbi:MAG: acyl transferase [Bacteroidota bacterium]|nr:acyl transferase [Bacteroidota bacterium]